MTDTRKGDWMQTASGLKFWPLDPRAGEVHIEDIAHALSNLCRYAGHTKEFYSVAQHSVLVSENLPPQFRLWGLLHDAPEAYVVDVPRPLKRFLTGYKEIEDRIMAVIAERFGLAGDTPAEVKRVDNAILADEMKWLMAKPPRDWRLTEPALGIDINPWAPKMARRRFLAAFKDLAGTTNE